MTIIFILILIVLGYLFFIKEGMYPLRCNQPMMFGGDATREVVKLGEVNHDEITNRPNTYVMVKYYTDWCGYCKKMKKEWEDLASQNRNTNLIIAEVDADANPAIVSKLGIRSYPTLKLWINGQPEDVDVPRTIGDWRQFLASKNITYSS